MIGLLVGGLLRVPAPAAAEPEDLELAAEAGMPGRVLDTDLAVVADGRCGPAPW
jgi:hypothetical protein